MEAAGVALGVLAIVKDEGDILKEFAAAARDAGIKICYYIGPNANGYMISQNYTAERFVSAQLGEFTELLTNPDYGPVSAVVSHGTAG